ncbi:trp operon leader peptide [Superficieibacter electus]
MKGIFTLHGWWRTPC